MQTFSEQQTKSANDAINAFRRDVMRWVILLAQMQSGKTETYLLIACELIRASLVKYVVVFSGNTETDLRDQLKTQLDMMPPTKNERPKIRFFRKYKKYLSKNGMEDEDEREDFIDILKQKITVVWGSELNSYSGPLEDTLFIWEEAHFAQSREQRPDKFLRHIGVSADGNAHCLERNSNYMLTISATPFSELSDNLHQSQCKHVVKMVPGNGYVSVKDIHETGRIVSFTKKEDGIKQALNLPKDGKKWYGIIRFQQKHEDAVKGVVESQGWKWVVYDSVTSDKSERKCGEDAWKNLNQEPEENTVILIRGKCRMGKNLEKKHMLFVFETSKKSNTDTVLQSLLGRTCGYSEGSERVIVYLSHRIVASGEIERYINMWEQDGVQIMPTCANNLTDKKVKLNVPIIPDKITLPEGFSRDDTSAINNYVMHLAQNEPHKIVSKNSDSTKRKVLQKILNGGKLKRYNIHPSKKTRNETKGRELIDAHERGVARGFGSGCGIDTEATEINIWVFAKDLPEEFDKNTIYITAHVTREDIGEFFNIPETTGREVFATRLEDGTEQTGNGGMTIRLSSHTANNVTTMQTELCKNMIEVSLRSQRCDRKVASCWDDNEKEFKGILVNSDVYAQLQKGGSIYEYAKREYGVNLHTCKSCGLQPKSITARGFIKLASISW